MKRASLLLLLLFLAAPSAASGEWGPWESPPPPVSRPGASGNSDLDPLAWGVRFFQRYVSPVDGPRCPMYPTCSAYALQALDRHGPLLGVMMTVDRLYRESDPREHRHPLRKYGRTRYHDPIENNDFWFSSP